VPLIMEDDGVFKHIFHRLDNMEAGLGELREVTWPVCQGIIDERTGQFDNINEKRRFFKFIHIEEIRDLLRRKCLFMGRSRDLASEELRQIRVEVPRVRGV
jgi:hypothetical protein